MIKSSLQLLKARRTCDITLPMRSFSTVAECAAKKNLSIKDLTGAGDLFAGGFLHGYINNKSLEESLETATDMSSKVIQIIGARLS